MADKADLQVRIKAWQPGVQLPGRALSITQRLLGVQLHLPGRCAVVPQRTLTEALHFIGFAYSPALLIMSGPVATPGYTDCLVEWTTNLPAYHRVRYKKRGGAWTTTAWSVAQSANAAVNLTGL